MNRVQAIIVAAALLLAGVATGLAQSVSSGQPLSVGASSTSLTATSGLTFCRGVVEVASIRIALDGSTPTATSGRPVFAGERIQLNNPEDVARFKAISMSGTAATLYMSCGTSSDRGISEIVTPALNSSLPLCNALTRPAGNCR